MSDAVRDQNFIPVALGESSTTPGLTLPFLIDEVTGRLLVDATGGGGSGTVTSVSVVSANGFAGTVATATTTPAITLTTTITGILKGNGTAISAVTIGSGLSYDGTTLSATGGSSGITIGTTTITSGTNTRILYNISGVVGEYTLTGSGTVVVMATAPTFQTSINGAYLTASEILITDGSKNIVSAAVATYPSLTELTYLKGVTSAIQTQINGKQGTITFGTGVQTALGVNIGSAGAPVLFNGALGTPSSGTVTNLTGTASININGTVGATTPTTGSFSTVTTSGNIELGNASDTTLSRAAAGDLAVEGVSVLTTSNTKTMTGKRVQPRTASSTTASTLTPDLSSANVYFRTTQTATLTIDAPIGTPIIGETIMIYVDSAGAQTLTINSTYKAFGAAFPATTTAGKTFMMSAQYNGTDWKTLWANAV
jgi:hypothetical protein